ncbi:multiple coagulation factor deficiency protein 2 [Drosophila hydei]|uniref:Multiple coagulation factor deficiency protein 2 n=1 Tax=Drosophila hydei TaxID=7224 RepID=A0A6J1M796_DROHY|nr:multiple coagulation factor deficiency protein 2 [Drosophila hydei]
MHKMYNLSNVLNFIICMASFSQSFDGTLAVKRGPHHPRGETRRVDQHLTHEEHRLDDDLKDMGIQASLDDMSEEEKIFYMFKAHDNDNNNALDGLEMIQSAMHHNYDYLKNDERNDYLSNASEELDHFIDAIDKFLLIADDNNDGLLHYPEFVKAVTGGKEQLALERNMLR